MIETREQDIDEIIEYLRTNIQDCTYMFVDIKKYRLSNPTMKIWHSRNELGRFVFIAMKYHTSISIYSDIDDWPVEDAQELIYDYMPNSVTGKKSMIEKLMSVFADKYKTVYGFVFKLTNFIDFGRNDLVETPNDSDMIEIARLVTSDAEIGSYYKIEDFAQQLLERKHTGMGRNYIIRADGKIIGHIATYAEFDGISTTGGLIIEPAYERKMLSAVLEGFLVRQLLSEGMQIYTFVTSKKRYKLLKNLGNTPEGEYGKMMRIEAN